ncbi:MAG: NUDIX domain-containing protein [Nitrospirae bacterium]|nr:NUDIX domain-containing protein [Nitrospirota bacterium]MBI5695266.1 NUDIX domain-containing protein [Nitrospirota bacterium]
MEIFEIVNESGEVIGTAPRNKCHGDPSLVHRAAHVLVFNGAGELLLQLRSMDKDIQPGRWDTSVGGHLAPGEDYETAAAREMAEELGITGIKLNYLYDYPLRNEVESENIRSFYVIYDGPVRHQPEEIDEVRFWSLKDVRLALGTGVFTPNFEQEFGLYEKWEGAR